MKNETVRIINPVQAGFYMKCGLEPLEIYFTNKWVWRFDKDKSNPLYTRWLNGENKKEN